MKKSLIVCLTFFMLFSFLVPSFSSASSSDRTTNVNMEMDLEKIGEDMDIDVSDVDFTNFEEEYDFLVNDPVFRDLEEYLVLTNQDVTLEEDMVIGQWIPVAAAAIRVLISKVGKSGMKKGWAIARPHIKKDLKAPSKYIIDGPSGTRIIQVRSKSTKKPIFRLDYGPVHNKGPYLHYMFHQI